MNTIKLSDSIKERMSHCKICKGKIAYTKPHYSFTLACTDCADWKVVLNGVLKLEKEIEKLNNLLS